MTPGSTPVISSSQFPLAKKSSPTSVFQKFWKAAVNGASVIESYWWPPVRKWVLSWLTWSMMTGFLSFRWTNESPKLAFRSALVSDSKLHVFEFESLTGDCFAAGATAGTYFLYDGTRLIIRHSVQTSCMGIEKDLSVGCGWCRRKQFKSSEFCFLGNGNKPHISNSWRDRRSL